MLLYLPYLYLLFSFFHPQTDSLMLARDMEKDLRLLSASQYFISDNTTSSPSLQTVQSDFQLFKVIANISLAGATYTYSSHGGHQIHQWAFPEGDIKAIYQIETTVQLDTVLMQRYLDNRPPTKLPIRNTFRFRSYAVATAANTQQMLYISEADQGLLGYKLGRREVEIIYSNQKNGLSAAYPGYKAQLQDLLQRLE